MPNLTNHQFAVNLGLHATATDSTTTTEADLWYNSDQGAAKMRGINYVHKMGPTGTHPRIYGGVNTLWYPLTHVGADQTNATPSNNWGYAYPFMPGNKCTINDFATYVTVAGTGNLRMMLYSSLDTGYPGDLIADYGQVLITATTGVISGWTAGTTLQPVLYYIVLAIQTSVAPTMLGTWDVNPVLPFFGAVPSFATSTTYSAYIRTTGFGGAPPASFGAPSIGGSTPPLVYVEATQ